MTVPPSSSRPFPRSKLLHIHQRRRSIRRQEEMNGIAMLSRRCRGGESVSLVLFIFSVRSLLDSGSFQFPFHVTPLTVLNMMYGAVCYLVY